jgi:hypothetical protein
MTEPRRCRACETLLPDGARFCPKCGHDSDAPPSSEIPHESVTDAPGTRRPSSMPMPMLTTPVSPHAPTAAVALTPTSPAILGGARRADDASGWSGGRLAPGTPERRGEALAVRRFRPTRIADM